jgi:hypothetical protein
MATTSGTSNVITGTKAAFPSNVNKYLNTQRATGMPEIGDNAATLPITSTNVEVWANNMKVGMVQEFSPSESRTITPLQELGTEGVVQMAPGNTNGGTISLRRIALFNSRLFNAIGMTNTGQFIPGIQVAANGGNVGNVYDTQYRTLSNPFKTLKDCRVPLEFKVKIRLPDDQNDTYHVDTYIDCWVQQYSKTIAANTITISESATVSYSDVVSEKVSG